MEEKLIPPFAGPLEEFPSSPELPDGAKVLRLKDRPGNRVDISFDVVYDERDGETLHLQILRPVEDMFNIPPTNRYPLIVYIPGSAWHRQMISVSFPKMMRVCERGYVVAIVQYRPSEVSPFPAQIEDAKSAIRYMRKYAEEYWVDPDRVAVWGDSSGGHTAVMTGFTADSGLDNGLYGEYPTEVKCIVDWFGPTDITKMNCYPSIADHTEAESNEGQLIGGFHVLDNPQLTTPTNPINYVTADKALPPLIILHGSRDQLVPFNQSCRLYEKLKECGQDVELYKLEGAYHGVGGFNSDEALDISLAFVAKYI